MRMIPLTFHFLQDFSFVSLEGRMGALINPLVETDVAFLGGKPDIFLLAHLCNVTL
jgi:hypothetical protein